MSHHKAEPVPHSRMLLMCCAPLEPTWVDSHGMHAFVVVLRQLLKGLRHVTADAEFRALLGLLAILLVIGTLFYRRIEGWTLLDALYFSMSTLATAGDGNLAPQADAGKVFTIVYMILGVGVFVAFIAKIANAEMRSRHRSRSRHE